ncbi:hypothetical protein CPB86DRAFT_787477 [Serendipita vermifera]|nr:hypothetical protein CPB86DRAFT_787477 [Serendipita vermifera]
MDDYKMPLSDYKRYGRQMMLDGFGLDGTQIKIRKAKVLVVGAGGLGCPALQHLAATGVGVIGIVDHDVVELSNLHRQILHTEDRVGQYKVDSAKIALEQINSSVKVDIYREALVPQNAKDIISKYDIVLDCTDNAPTRYLLSDTSVVLSKPLVSGAAMKYDGQLCAYNLPPNGPCYRCIFPKPPQPEVVRTCEDTGVLGVVTGIIGNLQALVTIKIITGQQEEMPSLLLFSALGFPPFRSVKIRSKSIKCPVCNWNGEGQIPIEQTDYVAFCGGGTPDWEARGLVDGEPGTRISVKEAKNVLDRQTEEQKWTILDVRSEAEFSICHLENSSNVPLSKLLHSPTSYLSEGSPILVVCRLGNDSQTAANALREHLPENSSQTVYDLVGGLRAWTREIDPNFPVY